MPCAHGSIWHSGLVGAACGSAAREGIVGAGKVFAFGSANVSAEGQDAPAVTSDDVFCPQMGEARPTSAIPHPRRPGSTRRRCRWRQGSWLAPSARRWQRGSEEARRGRSGLARSSGGMGSARGLRANALDEMRGSGAQYKSHPESKSQRGRVSVHVSGRGQVVGL